MEIDVMKCMLVKESSVGYSNDIDGETFNADAPERIVDLMDKIGVNGAADEYFYLLCLDTRCHVTGIHEISHGELSSTVVHPREIFKRALLNNSYGIVCVHNHPSGDMSPSGDDIDATKRIMECGKLLGVSLIDHLIVTPSGRYYSFRECSDLF